MSDMVLSVERLAESAGVCVAVGGFMKDGRVTEMCVARTPATWVMFLGRYAGPYDAEIAAARFGTLVPGAVIGMLGAGEVEGTVVDAGVSFNAVSGRIGGDGVLTWTADPEKVASGVLRQFKSDREDARRELRKKAMTLAYRDALGCLAAVAHAERAEVFTLPVHRRAVGMLASCLRRMSPADIRSFQRAVPCRWARMVDAEEAARKHGLVWAAEVDDAGSLMVAVGERSGGSF